MAKYTFLTLSLSIWLFIPFGGYGQTNGRGCATMEVWERLKQEHPGWADRLNSKEKEIDRAIARQKSQRYKEGDIITIPVVVHVVYNNATENISAGLIQSQLDVLNEDFRRLNADTTNTPALFKPIAADVKVEFCLATRDPSGNPTNGITRTSTGTSCFNTNDNMKFNASGGEDAWPADRYLNIWSADLCGGLLGYAQFPGGPANTDGVVIDYAYFGRPGLAGPPYDLGRTGTHEVGHWLNLRHVWGDCNCCNDRVGDTPTQQTSNTGCPAFPNPTCGNTSDMFNNYMDYVYDNCMNIFSQGQAARMNATFDVFSRKASLKNSPACSPTVGGAVDAGIIDIVRPQRAICNYSFAPVVTLKNFVNSTLTSVDIHYQIDNGPVNTQSWTGSLAVGDTINVTLPSISVSGGEHRITVLTNQPNSSSDTYTRNDTATKTFMAPVQCQFTSDFENDTLPSARWAIGNVDNENTWVREYPGEVIGSGGNNTFAAFIDHYDYGPGMAPTTDTLASLFVDLTSASSAVMAFDLAYARYDATYNETLEVLVSTNCGASYTTVYNPSSSALATVPDQTARFFPTAASDWRRDSINLNPYIGNIVQVKFVSTNGYGNNMFIDNVNIQGSGCALPLNLLSFEGKSFHEIGNRLKWKTSRGVNNDYFIIRKGTSPTEISSIDTIAGRGKAANEKMYVWWDRGATEGTYYYQLQQVTVENKSYWSKIIALTGSQPVDSTSRVSGKVYPNPADDRLFLEIQTPYTGGAILQVINLMGQKTSYTRYTIQDDQEVLEMNVGHFSPGLYLLQLIPVRSSYPGDLIYQQKVLIK